MKTTITVYTDGENKIKGYWNGKNYNGTIYINPLEESTMQINWKKSIALPYDQAKIAIAGKSTRLYNETNNNNSSVLPTNVADWMRLMERTER